MANEAYIIHKLADNAKIVIDDKKEDFSLSPEIKAQVDAYWQTKLDSGMFLFDGKLFHITHLSKDLIKGQFIPYRYYLAWRYDPEVRRQFHLRPASMSCLTTIKNHFLVGKRALNMAQYPGLYEFAPSGGVDEECLVNGEIDIHSLAERELFEETGITSEHIQEIKQLALIEDVKEGSFELCLKISLKEESDDIAVQPPIEEYEELRWLNKEQIENSFVHSKSAWLAFSRYFWEVSKT